MILCDTGLSDWSWWSWWNASVRFWGDTSCSRDPDFPLGGQVRWYWCLLVPTGAYWRAQQALMGAKWDGLGRFWRTSEVLKRVLIELLFSRHCSHHPRSSSSSVPERPPLPLRTGNDQSKQALSSQRFRNTSDASPTFLVFLLLKIIRIKRKE